MPFDLIIFDCDGTLVDSEYLNNLATVELLAEEGLPQYDMDYAFEHFVGVKFTTILNNISAETGYVFPDNMLERYVRRAHELVPEYLKPVAGVEDIVRDAKTQGKICVASNGNIDNVIFSLQFTGLLKYFERQNIFTAVQVANPKPAPDLFIYAAAQMNTAPEKTLVIEDSAIGVQGALNAGMKVYGFTGTHSRPEAYATKLKSIGATKTYVSFADMRRDLFA